LSEQVTEGEMYDRQWQQQRGSNGDDDDQVNDGSDELSKWG
jgi:hypothetical protein